MALSHLPVILSSPSPKAFGNGVVGVRRRLLGFSGLTIGGKSAGGVCKVGSGREVRAWASLKAVMAATAVESGERVGSVVEIHVTCYQILGVPEKAEKDEIVKASMQLKSSVIEDGYTTDVIISRQNLLMDVRDKLLFEQEYAGNLKEKILPKSSLRMPWSWLPGVMCVLQEAGEQKLVLDIGRAALRLPDAKPYSHDLLLSMALAECSIAKASFEKNKVSEGFEALARAQYLLMSKTSLGKIPLLSQIEESLEELAPACTLELLGGPHTPDNAERRRGAISALQELLRQGLDVEPSCRVQDWPSFLSQAVEKLLATEIVDLISWDDLAIARKTKKSLESQNQRVVIDFDCFYMAMIAHIALGFSTRQTDLVSKAMTICECLIASECVDLKFEEAFCSLLLGQGSETVAVEKLRELEMKGSSALRKFDLNTPIKEPKNRGTANQLLEMWLNDAVLSLFLDTRDCSPSLANFFRGPKRLLKGSKQNLSTSKPIPSFRHLGASGDQHHIPSTHIGKAVQQLAPSTSTCSPSAQLKSNLGLHQTKIWENWTGMVSYSFLLGCLIFGTFKLFLMQFGICKITPHQWLSNHSKMSGDSAGWSICSPIRQNLKSATLSDYYPSSLATSQMPVEEAETLVKQWQQIKAEALGPDHQVQTLSEVLDGSMLLKWQDLANSAKARSCFWRFVLLQLYILRAEIGLDEDGNERVEIEALLEEAAELVDDSQPGKPGYYSKYKVQYILRRQDDGPWRFCRGAVEKPA